MKQIQLMLWFLAIALLLSQLVSCSGEDLSLQAPEFDVDEQRNDRDLQDKIHCPDSDQDQYSTNIHCTPHDCNDELDFVDKDGYVGLFPYLAYFPYPDCDCQPADFTLVAQKSVYHIYYTQDISHQAGSSQSFGHATSSDGSSWQSQPPVLPVIPASDWDDEHIWAPSVVYNAENGVYYMFYTGVTDRNSSYHHEERIGVAVSLDLYSWFRVALSYCDGITGPGCIWAGDSPWTAWDSDAYWARQCRDPYVFFDPLSGNWYMVYSTLMGDTLEMVIGLARSENLLEWFDCGPISCTRSGKAESAHVVAVDGEFYLFWTTQSDGGIEYARSTTMEGDQWTQPVLVPDSETGFWIASETLLADGWLIFAYIREFIREFRFRALKIDEGGVLVTEDLPLFTAEFLGSENVNPSAPELSNGIDDNCNGFVDEVDDPCRDRDGDGFGDPDSRICHRRGRDCNDFDPTVYPGAAGPCDDGLDNDCDGRIDNHDECAVSGFLQAARY